MSILNLCYICLYSQHGFYIYVMMNVQVHADDIELVRTNMAKR